MKQEQDRLGWKLIITVTVVVLAVWGASWILTDWLISDASTRGAFGDKFGAVNALFSGLAFAGLIVTLVLQMKELRLQRDELACTREELKGQKVELEKQGLTFEAQNKAINQQRFDNTFFNLLKNHRDIVRNLPKLKVFTVDSNSSVEFECIPAVYYECEYQWKLRKGSEYKKINERTYLWQYFSNLYRIIKFVNESADINEKEKYNYICILRAQLSYHELWVLFYQCLYGYGQEKFKPLVEKYALFNNLDKDSVFSPEDIDKYEQGAYEYIPN